MDDFPENYHLRRKYRNKEGSKTGRTSADYYLYGWPNPEGQPKAFRSANEAFQHLVWLYNWENGIKREHCGCRLCSDAAARNKQPDQSAAGKRAHPTPGFAPATGMPSQPPPQLQAPPARAQPQAPPPVSQQPVPSPRELFRVGEVIWYQLGNAWRLGLILAFAAAAEAQTGASSRWTIRPLAHRFMEEAYDVEKSEKELRPYLAFSVPSLNPALFPRLDGKTMGQIDWNATQQEVAGGDRQKMMSLGLEASKVAATTVDHGYSTFNQVNNSLPSLPKRELGTSVDSVYSPFGARGQGFDGERFRGVFLGCERIELYDAVRVSAPDEEQELGLVLQIRGITIVGEGDLRFEGDLYCLKQPSSPEEGSARPTYMIPLPSAMEEEAACWNEVKGHPAVPYRWVYRKSISAAEGAIRGRFYPTFRLRSLISREMLDKDIRNGTIEGASAYLNNRRSSRGIYVGRQRNRWEAIREALPKGTYTLSPGPNMFGADVTEDW